MLLTATTILLIAASHASPSEPLICSTSGPPVIYRMPPVNPCDTGAMNATRIVVSYNRPVHTRISGWRLSIMDVTCVTHFFFGGSYTSSLHFEKSLGVEFPEMEMGLACPANAIRYTTDKALEDEICKYRWLTQETSTRAVCYIERAELLAFDGITTVDGHPVRGCKGSTCTISASEVFYHTKGVEPHSTEPRTHYSGPGFCNDVLCIIPSLKEAYPIIEVIQKGGPSKSLQYLSISGSRVWVSPPNSNLTNPSEPASTGDVSILSKIERVSESLSTLEAEVDHICKSVKTLYASVLSLSGTSPSVAASMYLNRTDIHAQFMSGYLMVWPCVVVDNWMYRNNTGCTAYIPIVYTTGYGQQKGYLDPQNNRVYKESPAGPCGVHYFIEGDDLLGLHQRRANESYIVRQPVISKETGPLFEKIELKASSWASSPAALQEQRPREFSYDDLTTPVGTTGRAWLETEIDNRYPILSYIIHIKTATLVGLTAIIFVLGILTRAFLLLRSKVDRIERSLAENVRLRTKYQPM